MSDNNDLGGMFRDAVSDVQPSGSADDIRARMEASPSWRRWLPLSLASAAAMVFVIVGAFWLASRDSNEAPVASPGTGETTASAQVVDVPLYYVGDTAAGPRLFRETHRIPFVESRLQSAVIGALQVAPDDPDYRSGVPGAPKASVTEADGVIDVDFASAPSAELSGADAKIALQALVFTANAAASTDLPVRFLVAGDPVSSVFGVDTSEPIAQGTDEDVLSTVSISSPTQGEKVSSGFEVTGDAATFEANVVWDLKQGDTVVKQGHTTAEECCRLAPYTFKVSAPPGDYTLSVHDVDESDGEGIGTSEDTKDIVIE